MAGEEEFEAPMEPTPVPVTSDVVKLYCQSPTNGRLEWIQAEIKKENLNKGSDLDDDMEDYIEDMETGPRDEPAMIIHKSLGGRGDQIWNVFPQGTTFDREVFDNEILSTVYHGVSDSVGAAVVTVRFKFKNPETMKPFKVAYRVEMPSGDMIENDLLNA